MLSQMNAKSNLYVSQNRCHDLHQKLFVLFSAAIIITTTSSLAVLSGHVDCQVLQISFLHEAAATAVNVKSQGRIVGPNSAVPKAARIQQHRQHWPIS